MEIDITEFVNPNDHDLMDYSASCAELGQDAGRITWQNCLDVCDSSNTAFTAFVKTEEEKQEARDYFRSFGAWDKEEIENWTDTELNALILSDIAGSLREYLKAKEGDDFDRWNENNGGKIYESEDGKFWFYLGN